MTDEFLKLEKALGITFRNRKLLEEALTHRSYLNEHPSSGLQSNERLEFLGDAVLDLVVSEHLFKTFLNHKEGQMSSVYAALVNAHSLAGTANSLELYKYLRVSKGEAKENGRAKDMLSADAMEAVLGAIYLDQGYKATQNVVMKRIISPNLSRIMKSARVVGGHLYFDAKSQLQTLVQEKTKITPIYKILEEGGPEHLKTFKSGVFVNNELLGEGNGASKQESEEAAAQNALMKIK